MKIALGTQSLILAGERAGARSSPSLLSDAMDLVASGANLKRVTLVASQPDSTVVLLRADYASMDREPIDVIATDVESTPSPTTLPAPRQAGGTTAYLRPLDQYALTQSGLGAGSKGSYLDVRA
jgi:hypothetical protein